MYRTTRIIGTINFPMLK